VTETCHVVSVATVRKAAKLKGRYCANAFFQPSICSARVQLPPPPLHGCTPGRGHCVSILRDKNRRYIGKSQSKRPPKRTQRPPHRWPTRATPRSWGSSGSWASCTAQPRTKRRPACCFRLHSSAQPPTRCCPARRPPCPYATGPSWGQPARKPRSAPTQPARSAAASAAAPLFQWWPVSNSHFAPREWH
jgi:hypothetical protein